MIDEYGKVDSSGETFECEDFVLENGMILPKAQVRYNTYGSLNDTRDNVLVICHALTGNSRLDQWWGGMLGPDKTFDTSKYLVVCANTLGSCYGSTGPTSINQHTGKPYGIDFPDVTVRDTVNLHMKMVKEKIGATSVTSVIGGSMGGMHAMEWAVIGGDYVKSCVVIACNLRHSGWQIGISETQRQAIYADPKWNNGDIDMNDPPLSGLSVARQIGMIWYRTAKGYEAKFGRKKDLETGHWQVRRYLEHQGEKILSRFDALTYVKLTEQLDTHDIARNRGSLENISCLISCKSLVIGLDTDILYPPYEQEEIARIMPNSTLRIVHSDEGHDGVLLEQDRIGFEIQEFLLLL